MQDHDEDRSRNNKARSSGARLPVVVGGLLALLLTLGHPAVARADVEEMVLRIDGLACPFCAFGIEKKLSRLEGVQHVDIQMDGGIVTLTLAPGTLVSAEKLQSAVSDAGFTLASLELTATGTLVTQDGESRLEWGDGEPVVLELQGGERLEQLRAHADGTRVCVSGTARASDRHPERFVLDITEFAPAS